MAQTIDSKAFRHILGHYPTGVCAITAMTEGRPVAMIVGSFTSVSLSPPLVAFFPDRNSQSWQKIRQAGRFCVNVLADTQQDVCRVLASKAPDKFAGIAFGHSGAGLPIIDGALAWIDCYLHQVHEAGDHFIAVGAVHSLDVAQPGRPLLFFQGGYGGFLPAGDDLR